MKKIEISFDHRGEKLACKIKDYLISNNYIVCMGESKDGDDYIDNAMPALYRIKNKKSNLGVFICGTGVGMAIVANRIDGIFAVHATDAAQAYFARKHENVNVLTLGAGYKDDNYEVKLSFPKVKTIIDAFLNTEFDGGRHKRRISKIDNIRQEGR